MDVAGGFWAGKGGRWLWRLVPWLLAAAILAYLFSQVPIAEAWRAAREARLGLFVPGVLAAVVLWFNVESVAFSYLFTRFNAPLSTAEARALRGTTYLLTPINWNLGAAAIILYLRRSKQVGPLESFSSMFFYASMDGLVLVSLLLAGVWLLPASEQIESLRRGALGGGLLMVGVLGLFMLPLPAWGWLRRLRGLALFRTHGLARWTDVVRLLALRGVYFSGFVGLFWLGSQAFGVEVPFEIAMAATPAILLAQSLPLTPAGLGTTQAALLFFFSPYGAKPAILAFGLAYPIAITLSRFLLALRYLDTLRQLRGSQAAA